MDAKSDKPMLGGVCTTLAKKFDMEAWMLRVIFVVTTLMAGVGPLIYIALWIFMPKEN